MGNPAEMKRILMSHVVQGSYPVDALLRDGRVTNMSGGTLTFTPSGGSKKHEIKYECYVETLF